MGTQLSILARGQRSLVGYGSQGRKESDMTERLTQVKQVWQRCCTMSPNVLRAERKLDLDFLLVWSST